MVIRVYLPDTDDTVRTTNNKLGTTLTVDNIDGAKDTPWIFVNDLEDTDPTRLPTVWKPGSLVDITGDVSSACIDTTGNNGSITVENPAGGTEEGYYFTLNGSGTYDPDTPVTGLADGTYVVELFDSEGNSTVLDTIVLDCEVVPTFPDTIFLTGGTGVNYTTTTVNVPIENIRSGALLVLIVVRYGGAAEPQTNITLDDLGWADTVYSVPIASGGSWAEVHLRRATGDINDAIGYSATNDQTNYVFGVFNQFYDPDFVGANHPTTATNFLIINTSAMDTEFIGFVVQVILSPQTTGAYISGAPTGYINAAYASFLRDGHVGHDHYQVQVQLSYALVAQGTLAIAQSNDNLITAGGYGGGSFGQFIGALEYDSTI
jgi:hypothetical protein